MGGWRCCWWSVAALVLTGWAPAGVDAACCYFSAQNADILQPAQKVFITWDPAKKLESFTVQPKFEGNALDFGMVIPTPSQPKLHEMPRDFFKHLAVYSIMKKREFPESQLLPLMGNGPRLGVSAKALESLGVLVIRGTDPRPLEAAIKILEVGVVGSLDYKIIEAARADALFVWLKANKYSYAGDEATLNYYVQKKWVFTVMKIDTMQMKKNKDGSYAGEVTPTRFQFTSDKLVYPLKITQISVKDKTEALFYVQAPFKVDLQNDMSYQYQWVPMLQAASGCTPGGLPGKGADWLKAIEQQIPQLLKRGQELGFTSFGNGSGGFGGGGFGGGRGFGGFGNGSAKGTPPQPNAQGKTGTALEWARRLSAADIRVLCGDAPYSEKVPNVDDGFTEVDLRNHKRAQAIAKVIRARLQKAQQERPIGYLVRHAPSEDVRRLQELTGHVQAGLFVTKFRKLFTRGEMNDDLVIVPARVGEHEDSSEYEEILPTSPP